jgi:hypothetical protein
MTKLVILKSFEVNSNINQNTVKKFLISVFATLRIVCTIQAQTLPNYVPTNGLAAWYPFNGNANDESGNANNGAVNGATLTTDRFGNSGKAYSFDGSHYILIANNPIITNSNYSISIWFNSNNTYCSDWNTLIRSGNNTNCGWQGFAINREDNGTKYGFNDYGNNTYSYQTSTSCNNFLISSWYNLVFTRNGNTAKEYLNGVLINQSNTTSYIPASNCPIFVGSNHLGNNNLPLDGFNGKIDDIGIWNRSLTAQEITNLFNAGICSNDLSITPQNNSLQIGSTAMFTATTSDTNPSYVWQSDFGQGFQTLNNYGNYSSVTTSTLSIANVQLPNHTQTVRAISTSGNCIDTSNVAYVHIVDTCINTVNDTNLITVTDTLLINVNTVGLNPTPIQNTIKVFPNPANTHITINYGNYSSLNGYQLKIENSLGQLVFQTNINQQSNYLDLNNWGGNGIYFVCIIDPQGNTVDIRKIILQ